MTTKMKNDHKGIQNNFKDTQNDHKRLNKQLQNDIKQLKPYTADVTNLPEGGW